MKVFQVIFDAAEGARNVANQDPHPLRAIGDESSRTHARTHTYTNTTLQHELLRVHETLFNKFHTVACPGPPSPALPAPSLSPPSSSSSLVFRCALFRG